MLELSQLADSVIYITIADWLDIFQSIDSSIIKLLCRRRPENKIEAIE